MSWLLIRILGALNFMRISSPALQRKEEKYRSVFYIKLELLDSPPNLEGWAGWRIWSKTEIGMPKIIAFHYNYLQLAN